MKLRELKERIDAGEMVVNRGYDGCGVWVMKDTNTKRVYIAVSVEHTRYNGFNALCKDLAWEEDEKDEEGNYLYTSEESPWEVEKPPTEEEEAEDAAMIAEFIQIRKQYGKEAAKRYLVKVIIERQIRDAERQLFTIPNKRVRSSLVDYINFLNNRYKSLDSEAIA